jgi:hypothetical protein
MKINLAFAKRQFLKLLSFRNLRPAAGSSSVKIKHIPTNEIHLLKGDYKTITYGFNTTDNPNLWVGSSSCITCDKNGCENYCKHLFQ